MATRSKRDHPHTERFAAHFDNPSQPDLTMTEETPNPFVPGARVGVSDRWNRDAVIEGFVDNVHKSGRFTLRGSSQQWRPWKPSHHEENRYAWQAGETGGGYTNRQLTIWNEHTDAELSEKRARFDHERRWQAIRQRVVRLQGEHVTPDALAQIESLLPKPKTATA